jgi:hypothetical protein
MAADGRSDAGSAAAQTVADAAPAGATDPRQAMAEPAASGAGASPAAATAGRFDKLLEALNPAAAGSDAPSAPTPVPDAAAKPQAASAANASAAAPAAPAPDAAASASLSAPTVARMAPRITASPTAARDPETRSGAVKPAATPASDAAASPTAQPSAEPTGPVREPAHALHRAATATEKPAGESAADAGDAPVATAARHLDPSGAAAVQIAAPAPAASPADAGQPARLDPYRPAEQVAVTLRQAAHDGNDRITIELRPASLGTVEVRLDFAHDGRVSASIVADRPDTLSLLKSDAGGLEQALRDAGLRTDSGSLSFNLRGGDRQPDPRQFQQNSAAPTQDVPRFGLDGETDGPAAVVSGQRPLRSHAGMLDIRI